MTDAWGQPQQQYGQPQQQWGGQSQQANAFGGAPQQQWGGQPQPQQVAAPSVEEFFSQGGGAGAPSFEFSAPGVAVLGRIARQKVVPKTQPNNPMQELDKRGNPLWQVNVVLDTELRGWQGIKTTPTTPDGQPLNPAEDNGERQIYLWYTLREAVEKAIAAAGRTFPEDGWWLGVKVTGAKPNPKGGNPIKEYVAYYAPTREALMATIRGQAPQQQAAPPAQQQAAPPAQPQQSFAAPGVAPQQQPGTQYSDEPPF